MKKFLRSEYTGIIHEGYYVNNVLPRLKKDEADMIRRNNGKYHYYYDVKRTSEFEASDTYFEYRNDPVVIVNVYCYYED